MNGSVSSDWPLFARLFHVSLHKLDVHRPKCLSFANSGTTNTAGYPSQTMSYCDYKLLQSLIAMDGSLNNPSFEAEKDPCSSS
ncbi:Uncharacterized protein HZ326_3363 [Fusarium oxysporum f. sp. albedinis]|nr:Uncharacterized protein HZ326_3363 [Fusarium oxysporum f. sp. albedinis]